MRCKDCKCDFKPIKSIQPRCFDCTIKRAKEQVKKNEEKKWKERKKVLKEKTTDFKEILQRRINEIARLIDYGNVCISCQSKCKKENGCHFHSVGAHGKLRYNLLNIWLGCYSCNGEKGGNVHGYDNGLIELFGKEYWDYLKFKFVLDNNDIEIKSIDFKEKISIANEIIKELKSDLIKRTPKQRLEMRLILNKKIGIYQ